VTPRSSKRKPKKRKQLFQQTPKTRSKARKKSSSKTGVAGGFRVRQIDSAERNLLDDDDYVLTDVSDNGQADSADIGGFDLEKQNLLLEIANLKKEKDIASRAKEVHNVPVARDGVKGPQGTVGDGGLELENQKLLLEIANLKKEKDNASRAKGVPALVGVGAKKGTANGSLRFGVEGTQQMLLLHHDRAQDQARLQVAEKNAEIRLLAQENQFLKREMFRGMTQTLFFPN